MGPGALRRRDPGFARRARSHRFVRRSAGAYSAKCCNSERPVPTAGAGIVKVGGLLGGARELLDRIVAFPNGGCEFLAEAFGRLPEVVAALSGRFRERRIRKVSPVANTRPIFLELDLAFEI